MGLLSGSLTRFGVRYDGTDDRLQPLRDPVPMLLAQQPYLLVRDHALGYLGGDGRRPPRSRSAEQASIMSEGLSGGN